MWDAIEPKLDLLRDIDRQCQAFGAESHRYLLHPCLNEADIENAERMLGAALPESLRLFYLQMGDGVAGPCYGMCQAVELDGFRPDNAYPGIESIKQRAREFGEVFDNDYFELDHDHLTGLISIIDEGCGGRICLIANGPNVADVVSVSADGYVTQTDESLLDLYSNWLNKELACFEAVLEMMKAGASYQEIEENVRVLHKLHGAGDRIASLANVEKPGELFGSGHHRIYYGATQVPWYENVLKKWQRDYR